MSKASNYYGGYFWVALVSFIVPLFVGYKAFEKLASKPTPRLDASGVDHEIWDYLLKSYVSNGLVDYDGMKKDHLFREYIRELGQCNPEALKTEDEKLALDCNAYNAFVINGVITHKIRDSVDGYTINGDTFFGHKEHIYAGDTVSLDDIEHGKIRETYNEPRIHVALVCAARSCPAIRPEAYVGARVRDQLRDQSIQFSNNPTYVKASDDGQKLELSAILQWYGDDFKGRYPDGSYLAWINELTSSDTTKTATKNAIAGEIIPTFIKYDWALNSQADPGAPAPKKKKSGGFGSGSSPDE